MSSREPLAVWLYGTKVATVSENNRDQIELRWTADAYDRWGSGSRVLSHLLPITRSSDSPAPARVTSFISGLLPEGNARTNYAMEAGLRSEDTFGMIARYGRDTAGALVFQPPDEPEPVRVGEYKTITVAEVGQRLLDADRYSPTPSHERGRDSSALAGLQPKITLHRENGAWQACLDGAPSTWIVKLAHPADSLAADVIDTEMLSLDLARTAGLASAYAEIHHFGGVRAIAVARYDRRETANGLERIHQEDLAQALGLNTQDPLRKFQRANALPSLAHAASILRDGGTEPDDLLRLVTFNHLLGNTDAHAKNISFLRHPDGTATLAPAYDIAMHLHHAIKTPMSALDINGKYLIQEIGVDDLIAEAKQWKVPTNRVNRIVRQTVDATNEAVKALDMRKYPDVSGKALETLTRRVHQVKDALSSHPPATPVS